MKDNVRGATDWEKKTAKCTSNKELLPQVHKELLKLNNKETNIPIQKWAEGLSKKGKKKRQEERIHGHGQQCGNWGWGSRERGGGGRRYRENKWLWIKTKEK